MTTTRDILVKARSLIASGWTRGRLACDARSRCVTYDSDEARSWCALGALSRSAADGATVGKFRAQISGGDIATWNDAPERTQEQVLDAFDRAIAACEVTL